MRQLLALIVGMIFVGLLGSCGGPGQPATVPVTGTVRQDGQPVEGAVVTFVGQTSSPASGTTDAQGRFTLTSFQPDDGAPPGTYKVLVSKLTGAVAEADPDNPGAAPEEEQRNLLPAKYALAEQSPLQAVVEAGKDNDFTFDLEGS